MGAPTGQTPAIPTPTEPSSPRAVDPSPSPGLEAGLHALVLALKARDEFTWRHSMRVADLAGLLAFELGWPVERVWLLHNAGLLHDIGKIALPDRLLKSRRPLELTPNDRELLRAHPGDGAEIAAEVLSAEQLAWVRHHHERWDGLGYPQGLGGHTIPEGARLLALAEAWDAMTAPLSRELQLTREDALADCRHEQGAQFAPDAVAALTRISEAGMLPPNSRCL